MRQILGVELCGERLSWDDVRPFMKKFDEVSPRMRWSSNLPDYERRTIAAILPTPQIPNGANKSRPPFERLHDGQLDVSHTGTITQQDLNDFAEQQERQHRQRLEMLKWSKSTLQMVHQKSKARAEAKQARAPAGPNTSFAAVAMAADFQARAASRGQGSQHHLSVAIGGARQPPARPPPPMPPPRAQSQTSAPAYTLYDS